MSFDPYLPPEHGPSRYPEAGPDAGYPTSDARDRVQTPAILLIALGVLNLFAAALPLAEFIRLALMTPEQVYAEDARTAEMMPPLFEKAKAEAEKQHASQTPEGAKQQRLLTIGLFTGLGVGLPLLVLAGGWQMLRLRSYGVAVLSAVVVAIPCVSPSACFCAGELVGLWALWVLLSPEVRNSFE